MATPKHHYIPEWYQRMHMVPGAPVNKLWVRNIDPQQIPHPGGFHQEPEVLHQGPNEVFHEPGLYRIKFGDKATDLLETVFFGGIDHAGATATRAICDYVFNEPGSARPDINAFIRFLDAQKLRTPKGLDLIKIRSGQESVEEALLRMRLLSQVHSTIWFEGVWEIFRCDHSETKLIFSDHPVTCYNRHFAPSDVQCRYPHDPGIQLIGTQTLFPLSPTRLLVISNREFAHNFWVNGRNERINPRAWGDTIFNMMTIHTRRQLSEGEVRAVNYITLKRAKKYVAAGSKDWLFPERQLKATRWANLGGEFFLRPDVRRAPGLSDAIYIGYKDGTSWGMDPYGRIPDDEDPQRVAERNREWSTLEMTRAYWDRKRGPLPRSMILHH